jgi:hypothetical protein
VPGPLFFVGVPNARENVIRQIGAGMTLFRKRNLPKPMEARRESTSWKVWFDAYGPKLLLCARQWTRSLADAEDVVQEAFVRYWRHQRELPGDPQALLITSVRRAALDLARRETRRAAREEKADGGLEEREAIFEPLQKGRRVNPAAFKIGEGFSCALANSHWAFCVGGRGPL